MTAVARLVTRVIVVVGLLAASVTPPPQPRGAASVAGEEATVRSEVRLRKLHLVRPDLIPYPIAYEVCC
jgi:hypothetical protein